MVEQTLTQGSEVSPPADAESGEKLANAAATRGVMIRASLRGGHLMGCGGALQRFGGSRTLRLQSHQVPVVRATALRKQSRPDRRRHPIRRVLRRRRPGLAVASPSSSPSPVSSPAVRRAVLTVAVAGLTVAVAAVRGGRCSRGAAELSQLAGPIVQSIHAPPSRWTNIIARLFLTGPSDNYSEGKDAVPQS